MAFAYISIGSNIDPEQHVPAAVLLLREWVRVVAVSTFYRTEPVGCPGTPHFINGVAKIETDLSPRELKWEVLRRIEQHLGRERMPDKYAPRTIDLDIALYDDLVVNEPDLIIPDPDIAARAFVAVPLLELEPELILPGTGQRLADANAAKAAANMVPLADLSRFIKMEIENEP